MIPADAINQLESTLGVDLPDNFGTIAVYDSDTLAELQTTVDTFDRLIVLFVVLFILASAGALALSQRRRRTLLQLMTASAVVIVLERRSAIVAVDRLVDSARPEARAAVRAAADVILGGFLRSSALLLGLALLVIVIALLSGPYPWAVRVRAAAAEVFGTAAGMV